MNRKIGLIAAIVATAFTVTACQTPSFSPRDSGGGIDRSEGKAKDAKDRARAADAAKSGKATK